MTCKIYIINLLFILFSCNKTILSKAVSPRINHVMLYVSNLEKSIGFYTRAFDLQVTNRLDTLIATQPDGTRVGKAG
jgi:hypothetical protein